MRLTIAAWERILAPLSDVQLMAAVDGHLADPERGGWWPAPADLLLKVPARTAIADPDAVAWDGLVARIARGLRGHAATEALTPKQRGALAHVGGTMAVRVAEGPGLGSLRKRFLAACRDPSVAEQLPTPAVTLRIVTVDGIERVAMVPVERQLGQEVRPALPDFGLDSAPSDVQRRLQALVGGDDIHVDKRERLLAEARRDAR